MSEFFLAEGASSEAVERFFRDTRAKGQCIQGIAVWKNGKLMAEAAPAPYSVYDQGELYSLSKSFCSTAVGMLIDEGGLSLDERIADIFPTKSGAADENLRRATVRDLLTMRTGHAACVMPAMARAVDPVEAFFSQKTAFAPGTRFAYNTAATFMLSAAVQKRTGMTVLEYLEPRFFRPLGIRNVTWNRCGGITEGGIGLHLSVDDIWRLGVLYLHKGVWEGKRLLSEAWVEDATQPHADNSMNGTPDWCAGYGYQFWHNSAEHGGFRGDGAYGQLCMVFPDEDAVVAVRGIVPEMQEEVDLVVRLMREIDTCGEGTGEIEGYPVLAGGELPGGVEGLYRLESNPFGWTQLRVSCEDGALILGVQDSRTQFEMPFGAGRWLETDMQAKGYCPKLVNLQDNAYVERIRFAGSWEPAENGAHAVCRYRSTPHIEDMRLRVENGRLSISWDQTNERPEAARKLCGVRIG